ncbi:ApaG domain [Trypanosoma melophagium]|uniref:ApaG domain n=1 Tax=Trypanosoma melophagium TaxID=715481 RepID=UPI003519EAFD|nr:ApaG domain [Trypanosoma melophagium]
MSVVRSTYRQVLKHAHRASLKYKEPEDLCFAMYGLILRMDDFRAAGYGQTHQELIRSLFTRPSITGLSTDTSAARLLAGFDALRRLSVLVTSKGNVGYHLSKERRKDTIPQHGSSSAPMKSGFTSETSKQAKGEDDKKYNDNNNDAEKEDDENDEDVTVAKGTVFIESSLSRKVKKLSRHVVVCKDTQQLPPYRCMMPPEPLYAKNTRVGFKFPLMEDAMLCMSSSSANTQNEGHQPLNVAKKLTKQEYREICNHIPTRTVTITDHIEVEVRTEHVCSRNPDEDIAYDENDDDNRDSQYSPSSSNSDTTGNPGNSASSSSSTSMDSSGGSVMTGNMNKKEHIFRYFVFIRNHGPSRNEKKWHVQLLSRHWVFFDEEVGLIVEVVGPGVAGNFPLLAPGESHTYESGASLCGASGVMRGTFQLNAYNEEGETRCLDVHISPTRLIVRKSTK